MARECQPGASALSDALWMLRCNITEGTIDLEVRARPGVAAVYS